MTFRFYYRMTVRFYYFGIHKDSGNEWKFLLCFNHAVQMINLHPHIIIENEVIDKDEIWICDECERQGV